MGTSSTLEHGLHGCIVQADDLLDLLDRQIDRPESAYQSRGADLISVVAPVAGLRIDERRGQQANLVIVAQGWDATIVGSLVT